MLRLDRPVPIVGAGIAGLTTAVSLAEAGFSVEVFERAEQLVAAGAGIQLSPNALRVFDRLGLGGRLGDRGTFAEAVTLRSGRTGRTLAQVPVVAADGIGYLAIHRSDLQEALLSAVEAHPSIRLHLGVRLERIGLHPGTVELALVRAPTNEPMLRAGPLAIAADGVRSAVAASLDLPPPRHSGFVAWRLNLSATEVPDDAVRGIEAWLGRRRHAVAYPVKGGREINLVLIMPSAMAGQAAAANPVDALEASFSAWDERLQTMIRRGVLQGSWPLLTTEPERQPVHGGALCLVGDSAHAMLPYAAQGAAMAIEDGFVLAGALASAASIPEALTAFAQSRRGRIARVRSRVRLHDLVYHLPTPLAFGRNLALALRSPESLRRDLAWLYDWRPPEWPAVGV